MVIHDEIDNSQSFVKTSESTKETLTCGFPNDIALDVLQGFL